jgi:hypothetical protein
MAKATFNKRALFIGKLTEEESSKKVSLEYSFI